MLFRTRTYLEWQQYISDWEDELTRMLIRGQSDNTIADMRKAISDVEIALEGRRLIDERITIAIPPILQRGKFGKYGLKKGEGEWTRSKRSST